MTGKRYYECHITMVGDAAYIKETVEMRGWTFSKIDGDPVEGKGIKCYATKHLNHEKLSENQVIGILRDAADFMIFSGITVTREKVELVIFDTKSAQVKPS